MKRSKTLLALALAATAGIGLSVAAADDKPDRPPRPDDKCMKKRDAKHLQTYDTNNDGKLDRAERRAMHEAMRAEAIARYDKDGDGELNDSERKAHHFDRMVEHFEELDADRNAEISRAEATGSCTPLDHHFDDADSDGNGSVTWEEFEAAGKRHGPPHGRRGHRGPPPDEQ